jgi:hypothetical protein
VIEEFNGLWDRGGEEAVPIDHFDDCDNVQYIESGFKTRDGLDTFIPGVGDIVRMYNYKMQDAESLIILNKNGQIFHALLDGSQTVFGPILTIPAMDDFGFVAIAGRAYINPFENFLDSDNKTRQRGISGEALYVYLGAGVVARKAAGSPPTGASIGVAQGGAGFYELGFHLFAVIFETDTGFLTAPGPETFTGFTVLSTTNELDLTGILTGGSTVVARHIIATKAIIDYNGDQDGFQFFFVPNGKINDNTTTTISISAYDIDLLTDASHLIDNFTEIPAGVGLTTYNSRLVTSCFFTDISLVRISHPGEPEAISQVDGLIIVPLDGLPVTEVQEYRDVLYMFKQTRTWASVDNGDAPATWAGPTVIDQGVGAPVHGIGEVLDSGGVNIEMLLIADFSGIMMFNGAYSRPELSYKIQDRWLALDRDKFNLIQIMNDTIDQVFYLTLPDKTMLTANYSRGLNPKDVRWGPWRFDTEVSTIALIETNRLVIGSEKLFT